MTRSHIFAGGNRLETLRIGPADGPVIVLLHEGLGSIDLWRDFPDRLQQVTGLAVFAYSRAGYGRSDPITLPRPLNYHDAESGPVLRAVLDQIGADDVILVGHSDGGTIAALYAGRESDPRLRGIAIMAPHFTNENAPHPELQKVRKIYETGGLRDKLGRHHDDVDGVFYGWNDTWLHPDFWGWNTESDLDGINVPVLALQGRDDHYASLRQIEIVGERAPGPVDVVVVEDCGHSPHLDQPEEVTRHVADFVSKVLTRD